SVVLIACDIIGLDRSDVEEVRVMAAARGVDPQALVVTCTHTHSGPDTIGLWGPDAMRSGVDPLYLAHVKRAIVEAAIEALAFGCPVMLRCATTRLPGFIKNIRDPQVVDDDLVAIQFAKPTGEVVATVLNLACHPEVLDDRSRLLSPDYAGAACRAVEAAVGGTAMHISGALGGMLSPDTADRTPAFVAHMGQAYAGTALDALAASEPIPVTQLSLQRVIFDLPLQNPLFAQAIAAGIVRPRPTPGQQMQTSCALIDLGLVQILTIPGELLPRLGGLLKAAMHAPCRMIAGLADDEIGYILPDDDFTPPDDYLDPGAHYEESMSPGPQTGSIILRAAHSLLVQSESPVR
ncbi:MAG TPA: hypothetical protein PKA05_00415, partial [Roseiflexaceae bacterium]|nr:hypothetical protein [Roseiflexaceae bacterium]